MSGIIKSVKKVFSKVAKVVKKVAPIALGVGAVVFTAGAALGVPAMAGGWGAAVSNVVSSMGGTGILGNVLTGAITQAGYGAALGAAMSGFTGGNVMKGAQGGALAGAVTGGLMGGLGFQTDPLKGIGEKAASQGANVSQATASGGSSAPSAAPSHVGPLNTTPAASTQVYNPAEGAIDVGHAPIDNIPGVASGSTAPGVANMGNIGVNPVQQLGANSIPSGPSSGGLLSGVTPAPSAAGAIPTSFDAPFKGSGASSSGGFFGKNGWLERNGQLAGSVVSGLGQGLLTAGKASDNAAAAQTYADLERERRAMIAANYGSGAVPGYTSAARPTGNPTPTQRFDPRAYGGEYQYDPQQGRIVFVPNAAAS